MTSRSPILILSVSALLMASGCAPAPEEAASAGGAAPADEATAPPEEPAPSRAEAVLSSLGDSGVTGKVTFTAVADGVEVEAHVNGLAPGKHGFHIHEVGDCSAEDGSSAGGHFNPMDVPHAGPDAEQAHAGDLGNVEADESGHAMKEMVSGRITVGDGSATDILGRSVIVHADADDLTSQPTGAAGGRLACGVITGID